MKSVTLGRIAEDRATVYLQAKNFKVIDRNWRTSKCEIDIVATKDDVVYLVEVKYRASDAWGEGLEYITPKKLAQMRFAAEMWAQANNWIGDYRLAAVEVSGSEFEVTTFIDNL